MANYPPWMPSVPPPVDPSLAGAPPPPWLATALDGHANDVRADGAPPPWVNLATGAAPPPFADELAGPPGTPKPPAESPPGRELPFWATPDAPAPSSVQGQDVPLIEGGQGVQLQHQPVAAPPPAARAAGAPAPGKAGAAEKPASPPMTYADVLRQQAAEEQGSIGRMGQLDAAQAQAKAEGLRQQAAYEQAAIRDRQLAEMERRKDLAQREASLEAERQAIAKTPIDNNAWYNSRTDGQRAVLMIGAALGGMMAVTSGTGRNDFTEWMDQQAAQSIESQKAMLANRQEALGHGESMYSKLVQRYGDERVADEMFASAYYTAIGHEAMAQAAQFDAPKAKENAQLMAIQAGQRANAALQAAALAQQEAAVKRQQVGIQAYEARTGRMNAETARQNEVDDAAAKKAALEAKGAGKQFPVTGSKGQVIGYASSEKGQEAGRTVVQSKRQMDVLYKRGRELFKDGWAAPGTEERARQDAWNTNWAQARRLASGDTSAPNKDDATKWGLDTSRTITNQNMAVLDESYANARDLAAAALGGYGVDEDTLKAEGYIPPPAPPTPGKTDKVLYWDEKAQAYNNEGRGTPLSPEQTAHVRADSSKVIEDGSLARGVWYDPETKTYNVRGIGERLSPDAEAQVRANPSLHIDRSGAAPAESSTWADKAMQGQGMPAGVEEQDWSVVDPKYWPQWYRDQHKKKGKR